MTIDKHTLLIDSLKNYPSYKITAALDSLNELLPRIMSCGVCISELSFDELYNAIYETYKLQED